LPELRSDSFYDQRFTAVIVSILLQTEPIYDNHYMSFRDWRIPHLQPLQSSVHPPKEATGGPQMVESG